MWQYVYVFLHEGRPEKHYVDRDSQRTKFCIIEDLNLTRR